MITETLNQDPDLFVFDGLLYYQDEDYRDAVELEIERLRYERQGIKDCVRVS